MKEINEVPINWESSGYSVLKNLNASILGVFCEFIDNSIQSHKNKKVEIKEYDKDYKLKIEIIHDNEEIIIKDNAGGINFKDFQRALKPANRADNTKGLNEFGLGMKYAAVWISNEWELISTAIGEEVERHVIFNYHDVVTKNLMKLPTTEKKVEKSTHYTIVKLKKLETKHTKGYKWSILNKKIASIYRNFIRNEDEFFSLWKEESIDLLIDHKPLHWKESGFLKAQWWKDRQSKILVDSPKRDWKFKFKWKELSFDEEVLEDDKIVHKKTPVEFSGFVGILPDGDQKSSNGFTLFRRGRMVEGIDNRIFPRAISSSSARSHQYIKLYGEIHFRNVDISFDKTKLSINREKRDEIFFVISTLLKNIEFEDGMKYNLINQASNYRSKYKQITAKVAIEAIIDSNKKKIQTNENKLIENNAAIVEFDNEYERKEEIEFTESLTETLPDPIITTKQIGDYNYVVELHFTEFENGKFFLTKTNNDSKEIIITLNMKNEIVRRCYEGKKNTEQAEFLCGMIICLAISTVKAENGGNKPRNVISAFNEYVGSIKQLNE